MPIALSLLFVCFTVQLVHAETGVQRKHTFMAWLGTSVRSATSVVPRMMDHIGSTRPSQVYLHTRDAYSQKIPAVMRQQSELSRCPETARQRECNNLCCTRAVLCGYQGRHMTGTKSLAHCLPRHFF